VKRAMTVAVAGAAILAAGLSGCSGDKVSTGGATKLTIDGKDQNLSGQAGCTKANGIVTIAFTGASSGIGATLTDANPPAVKTVMLGNFNGVTLTYPSATGQAGEASATKDGNTYKITGKATGVDPTNPMTPLVKPFELDATCG
jgi:ipoprotein LpqH